MSEIVEFTRHLGHYLGPPDVALVERAFDFSESAHRGQFRKSGEPYITHPIAVAGLCADWKLDVQAIQAALMHDTIEDQGVTKAELIERFGAPTAELVDGLTKLDKLQFNTREETQAESFRKMLLAMARDVRVILIKLADRLHNMRTLEHNKLESRIRNSQETLDIYAPLAGRMGMQGLREELEDLAFRWLHPEAYATLQEKLSALSERNTGLVGEIVSALAQRFAAAGIKADIKGLEKKLYSIWRKVKEGP